MARVLRYRLGRKGPVVPEMARLYLLLNPRQSAVFIGLLRFTILRLVVVAVILLRPQPLARF